MLLDFCKKGAWNPASFLQGGVGGACVLAQFLQGECLRSCPFLPGEIPPLYIMQVKSQHCAAQVKHFT